MAHRFGFVIGTASVVAACCMLAASTSAAAVYGSWGSGQAPSGATALNAGQAAELTSVSCTAPGYCGAGGYYTDASGDTQAFVVDETGGTWGAASEVPGTAGLNAGGAAGITSVSCASPGNCGAGGYYTDVSGDTRAFVVDETGGTWGTAEQAPAVAAVAVGGSSVISSVSCASAGDCAAGGNYVTSADDTGGAFTVDEQDGIWGHARPLPGQVTLVLGRYGVINSVSCASAGNCAAAGSEGTRAFVADEKGGTWTALRQVPGTTGYDDDASSVSCVSAGSCTVDGYYTAAPGGPQVAFVAAESNGMWGKAVPVRAPSTNPAVQARLAAVSCASPGNCAAGGDYSVPAQFTHMAWVVDETGGTWGKAENVPGMPAATSGYGISQITAVSCGSLGNCAAGGYYTDSSGKQAFVVDETGGVWGTLIQVRGPAAAGDDGSPGITSVSCAAPASCAAVGAYYTSGQQDLSQPLVATETPLPRTNTALTLSAVTVTYGNEQAERASVTVSASSGTPTGTVTVLAGTARICTITLVSGTGSCAVPATAFAPGTVSLTASYALSAGFAPSVSAPRTFTVVEAALTVAS